MSDTLIQALRNASCYDHPVHKIEVHETQVSWILLTGDYAYKIKKPLDYGSFLDYSTLGGRRLLCEREVRLNRRLCPEHYVGVIPISGSAESPRVGDATAPIEYAVKMHQFSRRRLLNILQANGGLSRELVDDLTERLVDFHERAEEGEVSVATEVLKPESAATSALDMLEREFALIRECLEESQDRQALDELEQQAREMHSRLVDHFVVRQRDGFSRKSLKDKSFDNALPLQDLPVSESGLDDMPLYADLTNNLALLLVDLESRGEDGFANHALNRYLELSGDYSLVRVLAFYKLYRALARARTVISGYSRAKEPQAQRFLLEEYRRLFFLSKRYTQFHFPYLVIGVGVSGSGKSRFTGEMVQRIGSACLRSDVERRRLHAFDQEVSGTEDAIYTSDATARTYQRLAELSGVLLEASQTVCIDATCLKREQRDLFRHQAEARGLAVIIVSFEADPSTLERRIKKRVRRTGDSSTASLDVLKRQLQEFDAFDDDERYYLIRLDTTAPNASETLVDLIQQQVRIE